MSITNQFQNDVRQIINNLPIERFHEKTELKNINKIINLIKNILEILWNKHNKFERLTISTWIGFSVIMIVLGLISRHFEANIVLIKIKLFILILYIIFSLIVSIISAYFSSCGDLQKIRSRDFEKNFIYKRACYFHESISKIATIDFESHENSIKAVREILIDKLNRQKYFEKLSSELTVIFLVSIVFIMYVFYGDNIFHFLEFLNTILNQIEPDDARKIQESNTAINSIFKSTLFVVLAFILKLVLNSAIQSEISTLQFCISVLEGAESLREKQNLKE